MSYILDNAAHKVLWDEVARLGRERRDAILYAAMPELHAEATTARNEWLAAQASLSSVDVNATVDGRNCADELQRWADEEARNYDVAIANLYGIEWTPVP